MNEFMLSNDDQLKRQVSLVLEQPGVPVGSVLVREDTETCVSATFRVSEYRQGPVTLVIAKNGCSTTVTTDNMQDLVLELMLHAPAQGGYSFEFARSYFGADHLPTTKEVAYAAKFAAAAGFETTLKVDGEPKDPDEFYSDA